MASSPQKVFDALASPEGRQKFWAERSPQDGAIVAFQFPNHAIFRGTILVKDEPRLIRMHYMGSEVTFRLEPDGVGGTDLTLTDQGVAPEHHSEVRAGWVSVLLALKACVDFGVDLRNHDSKRTWDQSYADN